MSDSDQSILHAIDNGSYRQAQTLVQKKLKKYPEKLYYYALSAFVLYKMGKSAELIQDAIKLKDKTPSDPSALKLLYEIFNSSTEHRQEANKVFENAIKKYPNERLVSVWFELALKNYDIRAVQKSTMALQKLTKSRKHTLWACLGYHLVGTLPDASEAVERTLFSQIALKLVTTLRPLTNEQEVYLAARLLERLEMYEECAHEILSFSSGKKFDLELQIILLNCLCKSQNWAKLYEYSHKILFEDNLDDFDTWKYLILAHAELKSRGEAAENFAEIAAKVSSRNSTLACVEFAKTIGSKQQYNESLAKYYESFKHKLCCFSDIKYYASEPSFDTNQMATMIGQASETIRAGNALGDNELNTLVNNLKLQLLLNPKLALEPNYVEQNFADYAMFDQLLLRKESTDYFAGSEFILLNVQAIIKADPTVDSVVKSIVLLEAAADRDQHEFRLRLWLMKLYAYINCHSMANANFRHLKIKMIQVDTLGHYINHRISTLSPTHAQLQDHLVPMQKFYLTVDEEVEDMLSQGFDQAVINKLQGFIEFGQRINRSLFKVSNMIEILRISKLTGNSQLQHYIQETLGDSALSNCVDELKLSDNRDVTSEWKFGTHVRDVELDQWLQIGPPQHNEYAKAYYWLQLILGESVPSKIKFMMRRLNKVLNERSAQIQFTNAESWSFKIYLSLIKFVLNPNNDADYNFLLKNLAPTAVKKFIATTLPLCWGINHTFFTIIEVGRNIISFLTLHHLPKEFGAKMSELKRVVQDLLTYMKEFRHTIDSDIIQALQTTETNVTTWFDKCHFKLRPGLLTEVYSKIESSTHQSSQARLI